MWCYVIRCYTVSRMVTPHMFFRYQFLFFRLCFKQRPGVWLATGQHDLAGGRDADTVWQQWRYKLSHTIGVIRIAFTFIWRIRSWLAHHGVIVVVNDVFCFRWVCSTAVVPGSCLACSPGGGWPGPCCWRWCWSWAARRPCCGCITRRVPFRISDSVTSLLCSTAVRGMEDIYHWSCKTWWNYFCWNYVIFGEYGKKFWSNVMIPGRWVLLDTRDASAIPGTVWFIIPGTLIG